MGKRQSTAFKLNAVEKVLQRREGQTVDAVAQGMGIGLSTLTRWMSQVASGRLTESTSMGDPGQSPQTWAVEQKWQALVDTATLGEPELKRILPATRYVYPSFAPVETGLHAQQNRHDRHLGDAEPCVEDREQTAAARVGAQGQGLGRSGGAADFAKKSADVVRLGRGEVSAMAQRQSVLTWVADACQDGARQAQACEVVGLSPRTLQRWRGDEVGDQRVGAARIPHNKLTRAQRDELLQVMNSPAYQDLPPSQIVPRLTDTGQYLASESTLYRVLREEQQLTHRLASRPTQHARPQPLIAITPNQIYSWDITYLPSTVVGLFFYLYLFVDIFSRKIVGWQVHACERSAYAADLLQDICDREGIAQQQLVVHSDNGAPMVGATMLSMMQTLGVMPSLSRPEIGRAHV